MLPHQIPVVTALEGVGNNLQDHPITPISFAVKRGSSLSIVNALNPFQLMMYANKRKGNIFK